MKAQLDVLKQEVEGELRGAGTLKSLEAVKVRYLGKKGPVQDLMKGLRDCSPEERPLMGKAVNDLKVHLEQLAATLEEQLLSKEESSRLATETLDVTAPGRLRRQGGAHPVSAMMNELLTVHRELGFSVQYGPDIETDFYNFEALNFGPDHPARDMHDTFYLAPHILLRTHTSNTQVRVMEKQAPPIRIAAPGRCYRNEDITPRSHIFFHQVEGVYIDKGVTFADLLQTLEDLLHALFGPDVKTRFRPSYFPFVEPGLEVDVSCLACDGAGCNLCKKTGWLEILGAGMVHPEVLKSGGIDPEEYSGYAWGIGVERLILLKQGVNDIRLFAENRLDFLQQFN